jgi:beta-lactam-binding protein with PASTA domain
VNRWGDRLLGIVLGLVIGVAIVAVFVFVFSEETVDAPSVEGGSGAAQHQEEGQ